MDDKFDDDFFDKVKVDFTYIDEYGMSTRMCKTVESDYMNGAELEVLGDLFKDFALACGFTYLADKRVKWVDDDR